MNKLRIGEFSGNVYARGKIGELLNNKKNCHVSFIDYSWWKNVDVAIVHVVGVTITWPPFLLYMLKLKITHKKIVFHWIGTDVLTPVAPSGVKRILAKMAAKNIPDLNLACAPWLVSELRSVGIDAKYAPIIGHLSGDICPLPKKFTVLAYIPEKRFSFHNGELIRKLSAEFPFIDFIIVGCEKPNYPSNVYFYNWISDMRPIYKRCSVLLRLPNHDGLSMMVLEALSMGRHVIYKYKFPFCCNVSNNFEQVKKTLLNLYYNNKLNDSGAFFIKNNFGQDTLGNFFQELYENIAKNDVGCIEDFIYK